MRACKDLENNKNKSVKHKTFKEVTMKEWLFTLHSRNDDKFSRIGSTRTD